MLGGQYTDIQTQIKGPKEVAISQLKAEIEKRFKDVVLSEPYQLNDKYYKSEWAVDIRIPLNYRSLQDLNLFLDEKIRIDKLSSFVITKGGIIVITVLTKSEV